MEIVWRRNIHRSHLTWTSFFFGKLSYTANKRRQGLLYQWKNICDMTVNRIKNQLNSNTFSISSNQHGKRKKRNDCIRYYEVGVTVVTLSTLENDNFVFIDQTVRFFSLAMLMRFEWTALIIGPEFEDLLLFLFCLTSLVGRCRHR